jgi:hypothetical protein
MTLEIGNPTTTTTTTTTKRDALTRDGKVLGKDAWQKVNLTGDLAEKHQAIKDATAAFNHMVVERVRAAAKVDNRYEIKVSYRFGVAYIVCDRVKGAKGALTI